ncbi:SUMF1/EgtB/PvdO family nonheme iron enzyme [Pseudomonas sp. 9Ag]|uniref:formylglycine-generating enzyme family protein n=1 Tax=Pseudomonas sp. 9Ag TaxID=2653167 RepID=UPI0012EF2C6D|nr:SUMF1/EgtB/PvdO family nonheme iron enzyme [Pseudomonas sp. 9Ag]VXC49204.1 conserved hypothetical protein [Pseudomonas sp. 9Ag]
MPAPCDWLLVRLEGFRSAYWEFAARDRGRNVLYPTDDGSLKLGKNYPYDKQHQSLTARVDAVAPNPLGLYMMSGGSTESVNDWYANDYYANSPIKDPQGPPSGARKVARGSNMSETPWISANTVLRRSLALQSDTDIFSDSFRCAIQRSKPL